MMTQIHHRAHNCANVHKLESFSTKKCFGLRRVRRWVCWAAATALCLMAVRHGAGAPKAPTLSVFTAILPQAFFVERVGGDRVRVQTLVLPGQSPHTYNPTPRQIADLLQARLYFQIGFPFEDAILKKIDGAAPRLRVVDTRKGVPMRRMEEHEMDAHTHGASPAKSEPHAEHDHAHHAGEPDPHIWLNPQFAKIQAQTIRDALIEADPEARAAYETNYAALASELDEIDSRLRRVLAPLKGRELLVYHPAYSYFADAYGLKQTPVEISGKEPSPRQLAALIARAKAQNARVIFVQPQFSQKSARAVADAIGGVVIPLDPLAKDYTANLQAMADAIGKAFKEQSVGTGD